MGLYPYQKRVKALLHNGKSVILQAPTGSGKTRAALAPFIKAFFDFSPKKFPKQCLYAVPMRVLATQFEQEYRCLAESYERRFRRRLEVRIQTGERAEDPDLTGDLVFATLDQVLSSALGVPYSHSSGKANVNVGAVLGSYLVFDEFHLFPPQATQATLQLLRLFGRFVPFVLMTATFSEAMLHEIACLLDAEPVLVPAEEVMQIETHQGKLPRKMRCFSLRETTINAKDVLAAHDRRSVAVCNTVDRALSLYRELVNDGCRPVPVTHPALTPLYDRLRRAASPDEPDAYWQDIHPTQRSLFQEPPLQGFYRFLLKHSNRSNCVPHRMKKSGFFFPLRSCRLLCIRVLSYWNQDKVK